MLSPCSAAQQRFEELSEEIDVDEAIALLSVSVLVLEMLLYG